MLSNVVVWLSDLATIHSAEDSSYVVCMQRGVFAIRGSLQVSFERAIQQAVMYLPLFTMALFLVPTVDTVTSFFTSCKAQFVRGGAENKARQDAQSFQGIPDTVLEESCQLLQVKFNGNLADMVEEVHESRRHDRFNEERCRDVFSGDPEFHTLLELATIGAFVTIEEDFIVQASPEPLRNLHLRLGHCIPQHALKLWEDGKALLFRMADIMTSCVLHYNNSHWTSKPGVDEGRYLFDCANIANGSSINSEYAFEMAEEKYLALHHPTIIDILTGLVQLSSRLNCPLSDLRLWKDDIKGAFGQFNINPSMCYLLATQVAVGIVMIYIAGMFGYHACPLIFGVFSRGFRPYYFIQMFWYCLYLC